MIRKRPASWSLVLMVALMAIVCQNNMAIVCQTAVHAASLPDYDVTGYSVETFLQPDGSAVVTETISCRINRDLRQISFQIPNCKGDATLVEVGIDSQAALPGQDLFIVADQADCAGNETKANTYSLSAEGDSINIRLYSSLIAETVRMFRLTSKQDKAVLLHGEAACLNRLFFKACPGRDIAKPSLLLVLPGKLLSNLQFWTLPVSLTEFSCVQPDSGRLLFEAPSLPARHAMTLVSLLPAEFFPEASQAGDPMTWESLTASARRMQDDLTRRETRQNQAYSLIFILIAIAFIIIALIYLLFDRDKASDFKQPYWQEMPPGIQPAVMALLLRCTKVSRLLLGTLTDLVRRKKLLLHGCVFERPGRSADAENAADSLAGFERLMVEWLFARAGNGSTLSTADIRKVARDEASAAGFRSFCQLFIREIDEEITNKRLLDQTSRRRGKIIGLSVSAVYLALGVASTFILKTTDALLLLLPSAALAAYSLQIRRFTPAGREVRAKGLALFRTFQKIDSSAVRTRDQFDHDLMPLAICLGQSGRLMGSAFLRGMALDYAAYGYHSPVAELSRMNALSSDFKAMESMLSSSLILSSGFRW